MMDPSRGTGLGLIDVGSRDWVPASGCATDCVIEKENALGARNIFQKNSFNLRIIVFLDRFIGGKVFLGGGRCGQGAKGMLVNVE